MSPESPAAAARVVARPGPDEAEPDEAERKRMAQRILQVSALSEFVLALRDGVRSQAGSD